MSTILAILSGEPVQAPSKAQSVQPSTGQIANPSQLIADATTLAVDNADTLLASKDAAFSSATDLEKLTNQMNEIIIRCDRKPLEEWTESDRQEYLELETQYKNASESYNSNVSKLSQIINEIKCDAYQLIEPIAPGLLDSKP